MFYNLFAGYDGFSNLFRYISFRSGGALLTSLLLSIICGPLFIKFAKWIQGGKNQPIRKMGPKTHYKKEGTPTLGGLLILATFLVSNLLWADLTNGYIWVSIITILGFGLIGFLDDIKKVKSGLALGGLSKRTRLLAQFLLSGVAVYYLQKLLPGSLETSIQFPFFKNYSLDLGIFFIVFTTFVIVGSANAVNITDGLDGLASMLMVNSLTVFLVITYVIGRFDYSSYLHFQHIPGIGELSVLVSAMIGACLGFLWFNSKPAQIFMGDTGSLALGSTLGILSVATKSEFVLAICGAVFVIETLSVALQIFTIKKMGGKKIFKMAPIHHHFELSGWSEEKVVIRFWIVSILFALLALSTLKLR